MLGSRVPHIKQVETLNYRIGGFHPVHLGDEFKKERYRVIHKLGHGGFATVWLARDAVRNRYVALKILAARLSRDCPEVEILRRLRSSDAHSGKPFVMSMLDHFWITGPNGKHLCVVSEVGGPSIKQFNDCPGQSSGSRRLRALVARKVALQATEGLAYIHSTGTVHGDFTSANILLQLANIDEWSEEQIYERLGNPTTEILHKSSSSTSNSSAPRYTIHAISMREVDPQWLSDQIMIIDFGIAFLQEQSSPDIGTPRSYCAPEFQFHNPRSVSSDIWALGCTIFEIRTGSRLFRFKGRRPTRNQTLIAMVKLLGTLPNQWWDEWEDGREWYTTQTEFGGELVDILQGTLYQNIMDVGIHDGDYPPTSPTQKDESLEQLLGSAGDEVSYGKGSTSRMVALVGELTTSEAEDVMALANRSHSEVVSDQKSDSASANKNDTGSGSGSGSGNKTTSGSSNAKSGEKSISSEGISTSLLIENPPKNPTDRPENLIGDGSNDVMPTIKEATVTAGVEEFLEVAGTRMTIVEAEGLENLLRRALMYLPERRLGPSELAKHHWFFDDFGDLEIET